MTSVQSGLRQIPCRRLVSVVTLSVGVLTTANVSGQERSPGSDQLVPASAQQSVPAPGLLPEPRLIERSIQFANRLLKSSDGGPVKNGFFPEFSNMVTGAGWISGGPGYRHWWFGDRMFTEGSAAVSWRAYKMAQARIELTNLLRSRVAIGSQARWQDLTQVTYFGEGPDAPEANRSEYRLQTSNLVGYVTLRPSQTLSVGGRIGWLDRPSLSAPTGAFRRGNPATQDLFPGDPVFALTEQPSFFYEEVAVTLDTRDHRGHPTAGGVYRAALTSYLDNERGLFNFRRSELEAAHFIPVASSRVVLAGHGWLVGTEADGGNTVPFYLMPSLGGANTIRAYSDFRFHDRHLLLLTAEARMALFTHLDAAVFVDAGNVAARFHDLNLDRRAVGLGLRLHTPQATFTRLDVAHGSEGWRVLFRMNDPVHLNRLSRRTASIPFVP